MTMQPMDSVFQESMLSFEKEAQRYDTLSKQSQERMTQLQTTMGRRIFPSYELGSLVDYYKTGIQASISGKTKPESLSVISPFMLTPPNIPVALFTEIPQAIAVQRQKQQAKVEFNTISKEMLRYTTLAWLYNTIGIMVSGGEINGVREVLDQALADGDITSEDMDELDSRLSGILTTISTTPILPKMASESEVPELPQLQLPVAPPQPVGFQRITTEAIKAALQTPTVPDSVLTNEEWKTLLYESGITSTDGEVVKLKDEAKRLVEQWKDNLAKIRAFKQQVAEMPDFKVTDILKQLAISPALSLLDVLNIYYDNVNSPLAGEAYRHFSKSMEADYQRYKKTENSWMAARHAWEDWDGNWFIKHIILENLVDPTNWIGWGIFTKAAKVVPALKPIALFEKSVMEVMDLPFDLIKAGWNKLPKTVTQLGLSDTMIAKQISKQFMEQTTGTDLFRVTMSVWDDKSQAAIKYFLSGNQQAQNATADYARVLLRHKMIDGDDIAKWSTAIGGNLTSDTITKATIQNINQIFEDTFTHGVLPRSAAGAQLANILTSGSATKEVVQAATEVLTKHADDIVSEALSIGKSATVFKAMRKLGERNLAIYESVAKSTAALAAEQTGRFVSLLGDASIRVQNVWKDGIDKILVRPFAQTYLMFGMYGPMNVLEDVFRSTFDGVLPGIKGPEWLARISQGLNIDMALLEDVAISETGGIIRKGGADVSDNWLLNLAFFGQKDWASKTYDVLVSKPGTIGMGIRTNFIGKKYIQILDDMAGKPLKELLEALPKRPVLMNRKVARQLETAVYQAATTGNPKIVRELVDVFSREKIVKSEVTEILMAHTNLDPAARQVFQQMDVSTLFASVPQKGALTRDAKGRWAKPIDSINDAAKKAYDVSMSNFLKGPEVAAMKFDRLAKELTSLEIKNPQDVAQLITAVKQMSDMYGATPQQVLAQASISSRGMPFEARNKVMNKAYSDIATYTQKAGISMQQVVDKLRVAMNTPQAASIVDWTKVKFSPDVQPYTKQIQDIVDTLPMNLKTTITDIGIDPSLAVGDNLANWSNGKLTFRSAEDITPQTVYHEIAHSLVDEDAIGGDYTKIIEYARSSKYKDFDFQAMDVKAKTTKIKKEALTKLKARGWTDDQITNYKFIMALDEDSVGHNLLDDYAEDFASHSTGTLSGSTLPFFEEYYPKVQRALTLNRDAVSESNRLLDLITARRDYLSEWRTTLNARRQAYFATATPKQLKSPDFWDDFYRMLDQNFSVMDDVMAKMDGDIVRAAKGINKSNGLDTPRNPIIVNNRPLTVQDIANLFGVRGDDISNTLLTAQVSINKRNHFIEYVMGYTEPTDVGFTPESIGKVYDSLAVDIGVKPEELSWMTLQEKELLEVRKELHDLWGRKLLPPEEMKSIKDYVELAAKKVDDTMYETVEQAGKKVKTKKQVYAEYDTIRQKAMDEAHKWYYKAYTDYTHGNVFDSIMKSIYPYWTYESQRWFWLPRTFIRHPGVLSNWGRWMNNTDGGYVHIPGTNVDINPFRGTVFGTLTRLTRADYPEYYDSLGMGGSLVEFMDWLSRYGFYPGVHIGLPLSLLGGREAQLGEVLPSIMKTGLDAMVAMFPDNALVKSISENLFNDRFRDYLTVKEVSSRGGDGTLIFAKIKGNKPLTPEEESMWNSSKSEVSWYSAGFEQFGFFRLRPQEQVELYKKAEQVIYEMTGFDPDQQEWLRRHQVRLWDLVGGMSPTQEQVLKELGYFTYMGNTRPLMPSAQQDILNQLELDWDSVRKYNESLLQDRLTIQSDFMAGRIGPQDYNARLLDIYTKQAEFVKAKVSENQYMDLDFRKDYFKEQGIPQPVMHPMSELMNLYFSVELEDTIDIETGERVKDWDKFFAMRQAITDAIPDNLRQEWDDYLQRNSTRVEELRRATYVDYLRPYNDVYEAVLGTYNTVEQGLIKEYLYLKKTGQELDRQVAIQSTASESGNALISDFQSKVSSARKALRYANPTLDAWLFYWGRTSSFTTAQSRVVYEQIARQTGRKV